MSAFNEKTLEAMSQQIEAVASSSFFNEELRRKAEKAREGLVSIREFSQVLEELQAALKGLGAVSPPIPSTSTVVPVPRPVSEPWSGLIRGAGSG